MKRSSDFDSDPHKANLNYEEHSITLNQVWTVFTSPKTKRRFYDLKHTSILEYRYYALGKLKNHGIIRIDYTIRDGQIRLINAFKAGEVDRERYYIGEEDF